jgi:hypothetical protein
MVRFDGLFVVSEIDQLFLIGKGRLRGRGLFPVQNRVGFKTMKSRARDPMSFL